MSSPSGNAPSNDTLHDQLHPILQEWSQLITSLASLIRENVEGLLPAVFGLANLAQRASEAKVGATASAREAGASLRGRAADLRTSLVPLASAVTDAKQLRDSLDNITASAQQLRLKHAGDPELVEFFDRLSHDRAGAVPKVIALIESSEVVEAAGLGALEELERGLDTVDTLLHADTAELEAAAARVKHFVESSRTAIDQLIVKLQFQDRTDQILQHLLADFESLRGALAEVGAQPFDVEAWRQERQKRFTTAEERNAGSAQVATDAGDIELF